jgi:hypothetical protein
MNEQPNSVRWRQFADLFFDEAAKTMLMIWLEPKVKKLSGRDVWFSEYYCDDPHCDCGVVMLDAVSGEAEGVMATIVFGWESPEFYSEGREGDSTIPKALTEGLLEPVLGNEWEQFVLEAFRKEILSNPKNIGQFRRHYQAFKREQRKRAGLPAPSWPKSPGQSRGSKTSRAPHLKLSKPPRLHVRGRRGRR